MELKKVAVASGNKGKIAEIKAILSGVEVVSAYDLGYKDEPEEAGTTFKENAEIKAYAAAKALGVCVLADDSGLCVEALGGAPGVYSKRYGGKGYDGTTSNKTKLLCDLKGETNRKAYFECWVCLCFPDGKKVFGTGRTYGSILYDLEGENGFGYDKIFYSDELKKSFGVATDKEKNSVSHRFRALCDLLSRLKND